jgi:hypothetical protein
MGSLIPGAAIIYTRNGGTIFGQYRDPPHNQRPPWVVSETKGSYVTSLPDNTWYEIQRIAEENSTLKLQLDKLLTIYYTVKSEYNEDSK